MACALTQNIVDALAEGFQNIKRHKGLYRTGKAAAVNAIAASAA